MAKVVDKQCPHSWTFQYPNPRGVTKLQNTYAQSLKIETQWSEYGFGLELQKLLRRGYIGWGE